MLPINLNELTIGHIQGLVTAETEESLTLEYKSILPGLGADDRREMLYDVAAMANASGGDLIYGIQDRRDEENQSTGIAEKLSVLKIENVQAEIARIENLIRDSIAPRLSGIMVRVVQSDQGDALVIRVPRSWNGPHMVTFHSVNKFFSRNNTGKFPMDVYQVGQAFAQQRSLGERIERWRSERIAKINRGEGSIPVGGPSLLVIHFIPALAILQPTLAGNWFVPEQLKLKIRPLSLGGSFNYRYNSLGYVVYPGPSGYGYTQLYRTGILEYVDGAVLNGQQTDSGQVIIASALLEQKLVEALENTWSLIGPLGISPPLYMGVSLLKVKGSIMSQGGRFFLAPMVFTEDVVTTPEIQIEAIEEPRPFQSTLLPVINSIWQAAGVEHTPYMRNDVWDPFGRYSF